MNIDVKSMRPKFYQSVCGGKLEDVLRTVEISAGTCHVEITNLIISNFNDTDEDFTMLTDWLASVNPSIPLHFSRYFPMYRFTEPPTPADRIKRACEIARRKLKYVYAGNITLGGLSDTRCPSCGNRLITRSAYTVSTPGIKEGKCASCSAPAEVVGV
jgi:pyruvate formate lyase activating enzyme